MRTARWMAVLTCIAAALCTSGCSSRSAPRRWSYPAIDESGARGGETPLHLAVKAWCESDGKDPGLREQVERLLAAGADVNARDADGWSPLTWLAWHDRMDEAEAWIAKGAKVDLETACAFGYYDEVEKFLRGHPGAVNRKSKRGLTPLHFASKGGSRDVAELLLAKGADESAEDADGFIPWVYARNCGYRDVMELNSLILMGPEDIPQFPFGAPGYLTLGGRLTGLGELGGVYKLTPIGQAIHDGDLAKIREYLASGVDINAKDESGWTLMHIAAREGRKDVLELLISKGADVKAKDNWDQTALHVAAEEGHLDAVVLFLEKGAGVDARDKEQQTPLLFAVKRKHAEVAKTLLEKGADPNAKDKDGRSPLDFAMRDKNAEIVAFLGKKGAEVNAKRAEGRTYLHQAAGQENGEALVAALLSGGADPNAKDWKDFTPLHEAVSNLRVDATRMLLDKGADTKAHDKQGETPLHLLAEASGAEQTITACFDLLVAKGADLNAKDGGGRTPLHVAINSAALDLEQPGVTPSDLDTEAKQYELAGIVLPRTGTVVGLLVAAKADLNARDDNGETPVVCAISQNLPMTAQYLLENGADAKPADKKGCTALHLAVQRCWPRLTVTLVSKGAGVNDKDSDGWTPLHYAVRDAKEGDSQRPPNGCDERTRRVIVAFLVSKGADVNVLDKSGCTALLGTISWRHKLAAEVLVAKGANIKAGKWQDHGPLELARTLKYKDMIYFLRKQGAKE